MKPDFTKMTKEEREAHKAAYLKSKETVSFRPMTASEIKKQEEKENTIATNSGLTMEEINKRNAKQNLPSSMR